MRILILTMLRDTHSASAEWALKHAGAQVDSIIFSDFPQKSTLSYDSESRSLDINDPDLTGNTWDVIWDRRSSSCYPHASLYTEDWLAARNAGNLFIASYKYELAERGVWVNRPNEAIRAEDKPYQLRLAQEVGFRIPPTLISNDADRVRAFVHAADACIMKPTIPIRWDDDGKVWGVGTHRIGSSDLEDDISIRACPMIYQHEVKKRCEYRVLVMGRTIIAAEIDSQSVPAATLDFRLGYDHGMKIYPATLDNKTKSQIFNFMDRAGIVFGAFDFARDSDGELIFFEVNQQGQFLWVEEMNPEIRILDPFVSFLMSPDPSIFVYDPSKGRDEVVLGKESNEAYYAYMERQKKNNISTKGETNPYVYKKLHNHVEYWRGPSAQYVEAQRPHA